MAKKWTFIGKAAIFGHNLAINQHIMKILVTFDRVDQGLSNDTKLARFAFFSDEKLWSKNPKFHENLELEAN